MALLGLHSKLTSKDVNREVDLDSIFWWGECWSIRSALQGDNLTLFCMWNKHKVYGSLSVQWENDTCPALKNGFKSLDEELGYSSVCENTAIEIKNVYPILCKIYFGNPKQFSETAEMAGK